MTPDDGPFGEAALPEFSLLPRALGHYRIERRIGAGGMGEVYRAQDTRLGRAVALKLLRPEASLDPFAGERLRLEARAASALNHPNICTIYEVGEYGGLTYVAMEFLEGRTLREELVRTTLGAKRLLDIATQVADALEAAHSKGIVHRDIKPENLFLVSEDRVKILDFGLAKFDAAPAGPGASEEVTRAADPVLTRSGVVLGTPAYMSPEQLRGEQLDRRSDLFALGAVLFEMAARKRAFDGGRHTDIALAVLGAAPRLPATVDPALRDGLQKILDKCLEAERSFRYQHAADLGADLRRLRRDFDAGGTALPQTTPAAARGFGAASTAASVAKDLLKAGVFALLVLGAHKAVDRRASGKYLEQFQVAFIQENTANSRLDDADFQAGGRYLPLVVDISRLHPNKSQRTDRHMLDGLVEELRRRGATAVGLDLMFDDLQGEDFGYLETWRGYGNVRVGIYRRAVEARDAWLGRPEFADLAAGIALPLEHPQQAFFYSRRWLYRRSPDGTQPASAAGCSEVLPDGRCREDLVQLPVALWLISERQRLWSEEPGTLSELEGRLKTSLEALESRSARRQAGSAIEVGEYGIDYSYLKEVSRDVVTLSPEGGDGGWERAVAQLASQEARIAGRVVLVGDLEDTADHSCPTPGLKPVSGVLIHACALATLNRGMVFRVTDAVGWRPVATTVVLIVAVIIALRLFYAASSPLRQWPFQYLEILTFGFIAVSLFLLLDWRARTRGVVWPHSLWVCGAVLAHPFVSEPACRAVASAGGLARAAVRSVTRRTRGG